MNKLKNLVLAYFQSKTIDKINWAIISLAAIYFTIQVSISIIQRL